ncbi:ABC transporter substrate-binding protein [Natronoarchaeum sp. GCM10025703]|uniref:ABC transporter substrate-binding protein n=1 Tax=unclassified Natronoarchaeum TaxID=2620183 RepID=UPI003606DFAD
MSQRTTRRDVLRRTGTASGIGAFALAGCLGNEENGGENGGENGDENGAENGDENGGENGGQAEGTVDIGVLQPLTGDLEYYGQQSLWGFLSGLGYKLDEDPLDVDTAGQQTIEAGDVTYELYIENTVFDPGEAQSLAEDLVLDQEVDLLFGTANSGSARRVISSVVEQTDTPFIAGPAAAADVTSDGELCSDLVFRASENTAMDARSGGRYVATETDTEKVYIIAADYSFGRAVASNYRSVLEAEGVEVVGEDFVPRGTTEFEDFYLNAVEADADAIIGGFTVVTLPAFLTEGLSGDYGLRMFGGFATLITNQAIGSVVESTIGEDFTEQDLRDAQLGPFTTRYHWNQYDNEINDWFVENYSNTYGTVPDLFTSGTFTAASSIVQAVEESGSTDGADIADAMTGMTVQDTPKGEGGYTYQEYNNQARSDMTIAYPSPTQDEWADFWPSSVQPSEPIDTVSMDETTIPVDADEMECDFR